MNRNEVKRILKLRDELLKMCEKLDKDITGNIENEEVIIIYLHCKSEFENIICNINRVLLSYCEEFAVGRWLLQIKGMNEALAAGLLAYYDVKDKECAAQFIQYAGVSNNNNPHNVDARKILDKIVSNMKKEPQSLYANLRYNKYSELLENEENSNFTAGLRADRHMLKIFIAHLFEEMYREEYNGITPKRHDNNEHIYIEPEVKYTR